MRGTHFFKHLSFISSWRISSQPRRLIHGVFPSPLSQRRLSSVFRNFSTSSSLPTTHSLTSPYFSVRISCPKDSAVSVISLNLFPNPAFHLFFAFWFQSKIFFVFWVRSVWTVGKVRKVEGKFWEWVVWAIFGIFLFNSLVFSWRRNGVFKVTYYSKSFLGFYFFLFYLILVWFWGCRKEEVCVMQAFSVKPFWKLKHLQNFWLVLSWGRWSTKFVFNGKFSWKFEILLVGEEKISMVDRLWMVGIMFLLRWVLGTTCLICV